MKPYTPPAQYFKQLIDKHGIESSKVVHHGSYHNLDYILDGLTRHFRLMDGMTILDVGAGKFDVLGYLENRVIVGHYRGVEVCKELCDAGVEHYAGADAYCINAALRASMSMGMTIWSSAIRYLETGYLYLWVLVLRHLQIVLTNYVPLS